MAVPVTDPRQGADRLPQSVMMDADRRRIAQDHQSRWRKFSKEYDSSMELSKLDEAIDAIQDAMDAAEGYTDLIIDYQWKAAYELKRRFDRTKNVDDITRAIDLQKNNLSLRQPDDTERADFTIALSNYLSARYDETGHPNDIVRATLAAQTAVDMADPHSPRYDLYYLVYLEDRLYISYERRTDLASLQRAVEVSRLRLELARKGHKPADWKELHWLVTRIDQLSHGLYDLYKATLNDAYLDEAFRFAREAYEIAPKDINRYYMLLSHLSTIHKTKALLLPPSDIVAELRVAQALITEAVSLCPDTPDRKPGLLLKLSLLLHTLYEHGDGVSDLEEALEYGQKALEIMPETHRGYAMLSQDISVVQSTAYEAFGRPEILDKAIETKRKAANSSVLSPSDRAMVYNNLSASLRQRYELYHNAIDISDEIKYQRAAVQIVEDHSLLLPYYFSNLSGSLCDAYERNKDRTYLEESLSFARKALSMAHQDKSDVSMYYDVVASRLWAMYELTGDEEQRAECLGAGRAALEQVAAGHGKRPRYLHNLARVLFKIWKRQKPNNSISQLEEAIRLEEDALNSTPPEDANRGQWQSQLAAMQMASCGITGDAAVMDQCISNYVTVFKNLHTRLMLRIEAGDTAGKLLICLERNKEARAIYEEALRMLSSDFKDRSLSRDDIQYVSRNLRDFAVAAAFSILKDDPDEGKALSVLDTARNLVSSIALESRTDARLLEILPTEANHLRQTYLDISRQLQENQITDFQDNDRVPQSHIHDVVRSRQLQAANLSELERQIKCFPGLETFHSAYTHDQMIRLARHGPIVTFLTFYNESMALILTDSGVKRLLLPDLKETQLKLYADKIAGKGRITRGNPLTRLQRNTELREILSWLWRTAVRPVLEDLGFFGIGPSGQYLDSFQLPRIWWLTAGPMGLLPLHAAGSRWDASNENTSSRVISSYVPTMKALEYARYRSSELHSSEKSSRASPSTQSEMLVVAMPVTPEVGWSNLKTDVEVANIRTVAGSSSMRVNLLGKPSPHQVLERLQECSIVHFACHGDANATDPLKSSLVLWKENAASETQTGPLNEQLAELAIRDAPQIAEQDGPELTPQTDRLTIDQLFDVQLPRARLAYLSACSTAQQYDMGLIDENINLGSVCTLAGFPSVVGTLWETDDDAAAKVAGDFYRFYLPKQSYDTRDSSKDDHGIAARCLHAATKAYRMSKGRRRANQNDDVIAWAPFVHIGA